MSAHEQLAGIIMSPESFDGGPASCGPGSVYAARIADAILAAGFGLVREAEDEAWELGVIHGHNTEGRLIDKREANPYRAVTVRGGE